MTIIRPDISYTVQTLSQFMHRPRKSHLEIALRLLKYLKQSPRKRIKITKSESNVITGFVDTDWAKCIPTRQSITGYCVYFGKSIIS